MKQRVIMAMSGGVDSSVAAALLKERGYDVIGVYILGWLGTPEFPCPWQTEQADAAKVAQQLNVPFHTINLSEAYEKQVIGEFLRNYELGITPNPDILCNSQIKFKALWEAVRQFEPDFLSTGHYARVAHDETGSHILKGKDSAKDQSYFLWGIEKNILSNLLLPVGELTKSEVRALAAHYGLATAKKKDSQGICFIGPLKVRSFLRSHLKSQPGESVLSDGRAIATHDGLPFYTIGQRLGAGSVSWTGDVPPLFVLAKDIERNRLIVGRDSSTFARELFATDVNWLEEPGCDTFVAQAKIRYRQEDVSAQVARIGARLHVQFTEPVRAITPGQSVVFYSRSEKLLGGGIIEQVPAQEELIRRTREKTAVTH